MARRASPTDPIDARWRRPEPLTPPAKPGGRRPTVDMREILSADSYHVRGGAS